jgi:dihydrofolate synthase/folylpolyglutamate synthase
MNLLQKFLKHGELEYSHKKLGLERVRAVLERLGHPENTYPSVLIAGTNGKGSVSRMVEAVMLAAGYPVGLYISPHLERFTERIRVGGEEVSEDFLEEILQDFFHQGLLSSDGSILVPSRFEIQDSRFDSLSWFEKTTVLAFEVFHRKKVALAVLEVGMGARLDATNVVDPLVSAVTSVSYDHTEVLGSSLFDIAQEKSYVMRKDRPIVLGPMDSNVRTFLNKAARMGRAQPVTPVMPEGSWREFCYGPFENLKLSLPGRHQLGNAATAIEMLVALKEAGFKINNGHIHRGLSEARLPGRLELFPGSPTILLDGAHNESSMRALVEFIRGEFQKKPVTVLLGMMKDKDVSRALEMLRPLAAGIVFTQIPSPRAVTLDEWSHWIHVPGKELEGELVKDPVAAFRTASRKTPAEGLLVVAGSFYLAGIIRPLLSRGAMTG